MQEPIEEHEMTPTEELIKQDFDNQMLEEESKKGHRRSKNDVEGRTYKCKLCGKSYLSYPALYTHSKQKHNTCNTSGRGRGRPKKESGENNAERMQFNPLDSTFFSKEERKGSTSNFDKCIQQAFDDLYKKTEESILTSKNIKKYNNIEEHPFLNKFKNDKHDVNKKIENENEISDNVFIDYLNKMSIYANENYFAKLIRFVTLFREYVNISKKNTGNNTNDGGDYTASNNAEDVPDISNEFINDFIDPDSKTFDFIKDECIDLTQNLCHWMYENNFTCSKLSLINNDK